jgi:lipopolysaccharide/colanic/teichoic acid biosynthesis glycosyltransferase
MKGSPQTAKTRMGAMTALRKLEFACLEVAPALVAAAVTAGRLGGGAAALVGCGVFACSWALGKGGYPLHLMPLGGALARGLAVLTGVLCAWLVSLTLVPLSATALIAPLLAAWIMLCFGLAFTERLEPRLAIRVAVIGSPALGAALAGELELLGLRRWELVGWIDFTDDGLPTPVGAPPRLGFAESMETIVAEHDIDLIVFGVRESEREAGEWLGVSSLGALERVIEVCVGLDLRVIGADQFFEHAFGHVPIAAINAAWFQYVIHPRFRSTPPLRKRLFDVAFAFGIAVVLAPLFLVAMVLVKLFGGPGPVFHVQRRVGEGGREYTLRKLRTMREDAEVAGTPAWSGDDDARQTRVGRVLRHTHLDEMPQLWNVVRGEMSVVGPRPERRQFVQRLERELPFYDRRLLVKPGLTGWAQVSCGYAGSEAGTAWKLSYDLFYLKHRSAVFDLLIGVETIAVPLRDLRRPRSHGAGALVLPHHLRDPGPASPAPHAPPATAVAEPVTFAQARKR